MSNLILNQEIVLIHDEVAKTTSKIVADSFGKLHKNVMRKIDELSSETPSEWYKLNFEPIQIQSDLGQGRTRQDKAYEMTKDGFMLLVMGFTGKKAMQTKIAFIEAFNWMQERLTKGGDNGLSTVQSRLPLKDAVNAMVAKTHQTYSDCWRMVHQYMGISSVEELTNRQIPEAVEYVHRVCLSWEAAQNQPKRKCTDGHIIELASLSLELGHWYRFIKPALAILAPEANASMHNVAYELAMSAHNIMYDYGQEEKVKALLQEYEIGGEQHGKLYVDKARMIRELAPA